MSLSTSKMTPNCRCYGCEEPVWFNPRSKRFSTHCSNICRLGNCIHREQEQLDKGEISPMQFGAMGIGENRRRGMDCVCPGCSAKAWYDSRLGETQFFCSKECRDQRCNHGTSENVTR